MKLQNKKKESTTIKGNNYLNNKYQFGPQRKILKKKPQKYYQQIKFFGNALYELEWKKFKKTNETFSLLETCLFKKNDYELSSRSIDDPSLYRNDYSSMSNKRFKEKFLESFNDEEEKQTWIEYFNTEERTVFARQLTQKLNKLNYLNLQYDQWSYYHELGRRERIWYGRVSKKIAIVNSMSLSYGRRKSLTLERRNYFQNEIKACKNKIEEFTNQVSLSIDTKVLECGIQQFIHREQYRLRLELERQRLMLRFNAQDHKLVKQFYEINPRQTEV
jgi:hypothetical protein